MWGKMAPDMLFQDWAGVGRTALMGLLAYGAMIVMLRVSGKRTLAKLNAFDLVVTVALGSILATIILSRDVALAEGVAALLTLIGLQFALTFLSVRWPALAGLVRSEPDLLLRDGKMCDAAMRRARVTRDELLTVIRRRTQARPENVAAVILEADGSFSVIPKESAAGRAPIPGVELEERDRSDPVSDQP